MEGRVDGRAQHKMNVCMSFPMHVHTPVRVTQTSDALLNIAVDECDFVLVPLLSRSTTICFVTSAEAMFSWETLRSELEVPSVPANTKRCKTDRYCTMDHAECA